MKHLRAFISEARNEYEVYHDSYGSVVDEVEKYAKSKGYTLDQTEYGNAYMDAFDKPKDGETKQDSFTLYKGGATQAKLLHVQITGLGTRFEINMYIN